MRDEGKSTWKELALDLEHGREPWRGLYLAGQGRTPCASDHWLRVNSEGCLEEALEAATVLRLCTHLVGDEAA